jgi:hypothetical protein
MAAYPRSTALLGLYAALLVSASAAHCSGGNRAVALLLPLLPRLRPDSFVVWRFRSGQDSGATVLASMVGDEAVGKDDSTTVAVVTSWGMPVGSRDSLIVERRTLADRAVAAVRASPVADRAAVLRSGRGPGARHDLGRRGYGAGGGPRRLDRPVCRSRSRPALRRRLRVAANRSDYDAGADVRYPVRCPVALNDRDVHARP